MQAAGFAGRFPFFAEISRHQLDITVDMRIMVPLSDFFVTGYLMQSTPAGYTQLKHQQRRRDRQRLLGLWLLLAVGVAVSLCAGEHWIAPTHWLDPESSLFYLATALAAHAGSDAGGGGAGNERCGYAGSV
ncbi:hypothetical protein OS21_18630 [Dickeya oryzae]